MIIALYFTYKNSRFTVAETSLEFDYNAMEQRVADKIRRLHEEVRNKPDSAAAWGKLGMTLDVHGLNQEAIRCYKKAADLDPNDFRWAYFCAIALKENGSSESLQWFQTASQQKPDYLPLQLRLARALFDAGMLKESESHFVQAIQFAPNSADAYVGRTQIAMQRNELQAAIQFAEKAVELNPKQVEAYNLLAALYRRSQESTKASEALERARALPQKSAFSDPVYSALVAEGESAFWYRTRGRTYMDAGLYLLALREFKTALELHEDADAYDHLGTALQRLGKWEEAVLNHKKAIAMSPGYLRFYNLGIAYGRLNRIPEAIGAFQNSIRMKPENAEALYNLGVAHFKLSHWEEAVTSLKGAVEQNPDHANAHFALGMAYLAKGKRNLAMQEYETLQRLSPQLAMQLKSGSR